MAPRVMLEASGHRAYCTLWGDLIKAAHAANPVTVVALMTLQRGKVKTLVVLTKSE